jgi:hypothetical protein
MVEEDLIDPENSTPTAYIEWLKERPKENALVFSWADGGSNIITATTNGSIVEDVPHSSPHALRNPNARVSWLSRSEEPDTVELSNTQFSGEVNK